VVSFLVLNQLWIWLVTCILVFVAAVVVPHCIVILGLAALKVWIVILFIGELGRHLAFVLIFIRIRVILTACVTTAWYHRLKVVCLFIVSLVFLIIWRIRPLAHFTFEMMMSPMTLHIAFEALYHTSFWLIALLLLPIHIVLNDLSVFVWGRRGWIWIWIMLIFTVSMLMLFFFKRNLAHNEAGQQTLTPTEVYSLVVVD